MVDKKVISEVTFVQWMKMTQQNIHSSDEQLCGIFQVDGKSLKFMFEVTVNRVQIKMEVDRAERSTILTALFEERLRTACKMVPSQVTLWQYDQAQLKVVGQCKANVQIGKQHLTETLIIVDILSKHPLPGRDLLMEMGITMDTVLNQEPLETFAVRQTWGEDDIVTEYNDLFKKELSLLQNVKADFAVEQTATPRFYRSRPIPFALRDKVEKALRALVEVG